MEKNKFRILWTVSAICMHTIAQSQNFVQHAKVVTFDRAQEDEFGSAAAISGDYAVITAISEDHDSNGGGTVKLSAGSAYFYKQDGAGNWIFDQKVVTSDRTSNDLFGGAAAIDGDQAIIAASAQDRDANGMNLLDNAGAVYIFKRNSGGTWIEQQKLVSSDRAEGDQLGHSASISVNYAIAGANFDDQDENGINTMSSAGSAYIFKKDEETGTWSEEKKIVASDRGVDHWFGRSVAISGDHALVGAYRKNSFTGSAYIFKKDHGGTDNWGEVKKLESSDLAEGDWFGVKVAIEGDIAVVAAYNEDEDADGNNTLDDPGSVYVFRKDEGGEDNWGQVQKLVAFDRSQDARFGRSVAISGSRLVVGAFLDGNDVNGNNNVDFAGSAYIFRKEASGQWVLEQKIVASDRGMDDAFGESVAISVDQVVVTANFEDHDASGNNFLEDAGSAYVYQFVKGDQAITFEQPEDKVFSDPSFELNATASSGLEISYASSDENVATISGNTVTIQGIGTIDITASQPGDDRYNAAVDVVRTLTIGKAPQNITFELGNNASKTFGDDGFILTASVDSGLKLSFSSSDEAVASIDGTAVTIKAAGTATITASQSGSENYLPASKDQVVTIEKAGQTITFDPLPEFLTTESEDFELSATASSGLEVSFELENPDVASVDGSTVSIIGPGETMITAFQKGTDNFLAAEPVSRTLIIEEVLSVAEVGSPSIMVYPNPAVNFIEISGIMTDYSLQIFDLEGRLFLNRRISAKELIRLPFDRGIYVGKVVSEEGQLIKTFKLIKN